MKTKSDSAGALRSAKSALARRDAKRSGMPLYVVSALAVSAILGASALVNRQLAKRTERKNPPRGRFVETRGARLHVVERGQGEALVLLHGNGVTVEDLEASGLLALATTRYRVVAIDRPGFGHSTRSSGSVWTDEEQAKAIAEALTAIGVPRAIVFGHSWGCTVAMALALNHPERVSALVLASGYYYPSARTDAAASAMQSIPVLGHVIRHAISPWLARATWPLLVRKLFSPAPAPSKFDAFPKDMAFRPSQLGASAADAALMVPDAALQSRRYGELKMPVVVIAGEGDRVVDFDDQSARLHANLPQSTLHRVLGAGHMIHYSATDEVMAAIDEAAAKTTTKASVADGSAAVIRKEAAF